MNDALARLKEALAGRYAIERELGSGGMGTVYLAFDRDRHDRVALKTLHWADASSIYRFKQEFRALADVAHTNLVQLYELVAQDDVWFFTMELVDGEDFLHYVRPGGDPAREGGPDVARLRPALRQLVAGIAALHRAGTLHRDLKPANVMVTREGRVVILDFGIAREIAASQSRRSLEDVFSGTLGYMAPEQCAGESTGPASDWYSLGALLYEALTGQLPFTGAMLHVLTQKQLAEPPRADTLVPDLPGDLVDLAAALLARAPERRPTEAELLRRLRLSEPAVVLAPGAARAESPAVVGRAAALEVLEDAFGTAAAGRAVSLCVTGPSGIGKSVLVHHFTHGLLESQRAVVFGGRCYVRESVPYKALDGVMDAMSRLLRGLPAETVESRLPAGTGALAHVFPVLRRVEAINRRAEAELDVSDRRDLRRRAFAALREALEALARERPVVIHIDDLQWADRDSLDALEDLLGSLEGRLLLILSFRSEDVAGVPFLARLHSRATTPTRKVLAVGPLSAEDAAGFARAMLGDWPEAETYAATLARESDGNPFLLDQMVRSALEAGGRGHTGSFTLGAMLDARLRQMPAGARELVEVLALAGQPVDAEVAYRTAGLAGDERPLVTSLQIAHVLRAGARGERIDLYHDRIREHVAQQLAAPRSRAIHRRLAEALEARGADDPEPLYEHYLGAGEPARAAVFAGRTAAAALSALAFERAAHFYQRALDLSPDADPGRRSYSVGLGDALASAGRGAEAARAYLQAAALADDDLALELERRAGQQLLISGRIDEGLATMGRVLARVDLALAPTPARALLTLLLRRLRLRLRGLHYREREADQVPAGSLTRIDTCWAVAEGLALVDNIQGAAFQALHLILALEAGEPNRIARALAMEAGFIASSGSYEDAMRMLRRAEAMARRLDSRSVLGLCRLIGSAASYHGGRPEEGVAYALEAEEILTRQQAFAAWPLNAARIYHLSNLIERGDIAEVRRLSVEFLKDALDRGNRFAATMFRTGWATLVWLGADDLAGARGALAEAREQYGERVFHIPHYYCLLAQAMIDLYSGEGEVAFRHVVDTWPRLRASQLLRVRSIHIHCRMFRAAAAVAAAATSREAPRLLRIAERDARRIERERHFSVRSNQAKAALIRAGIAATRGDRALALRLLAEATDGFSAAQAGVFRAVSARRRGELLGGEEGRAWIADADAWMTGQGVANPERLAATLAPGFPGASARRAASPPPR